MTTTAIDQVRGLSQRWVRAERAADAAALDAMSTADYTVVGPVGYPLTRQQILQRCRGDALVTHELTYDQVVLRVYGDAALSIGVHTQRADYQGNPVDGRFRSPHSTVRDGNGWRLAATHPSPTGGPPPFIPRTTAANPATR